MTFPSEYPIDVKRPAQRSIPASLALLGMLFFPLLLVSTSSAQIGGAATSAASSGGGHASSGASFGAPATTLTSSGHVGHVSANSRGTFSTHTPHSPSGPGGSNDRHQHRTANGDLYYPYWYYPYWYAVPVPYVVDADTSDISDNDNGHDPDYQGGPTIFDRRGLGAASYVPPSYEGPAHAPAPDSQAQAQAEDAPQASHEIAAEPPQPPTTLVFKDGHQLEIENYAIVRQTLYDLTPRHPRKIALADLDLPATQKQNDDRGVIFQLPPSLQAN